MLSCVVCGRRFRDDGLSHGPGSKGPWCITPCYDMWMAAHPEEAEGWVSVGDLNPLQMAELKALLGQGELA